MQVVKVRYSGSVAKYTYKYELDEAVDVNDMVVVRARGLLCLAKVVEVGGQELLDPTATYEYLRVIDRVDLTHDNGVKKAD